MSPSKSHKQRSSKAPGRRHRRERAHSHHPSQSQHSNPNPQHRHQQHRSSHPSSQQPSSQASQLQQQSLPVQPQHPQQLPSTVSSSQQVLEAQNTQLRQQLQQQAKELTSLSAIEHTHSADSDYNLLLTPMFSAMTKITDNLFLTGVGGMTRENFRKNHIDFVVNITTEAPFWEDIESMRLPLEDDVDTNILPYLDTAVDRINEAITQRDAHVLVHCVAGVSRSATIVIAYLMKYKQMDLHAAFNYCYNLRPVIRPNNGFMQQLMHYELQLFNQNSVQMVDADVDGTLIRVPQFFIAEHPRLVLLEVMRVLEEQRLTAATVGAPRAAVASARKQPPSAIQYQSRLQSAPKLPAGSQLSALSSIPTTPTISSGLSRAGPSTLNSRVSAALKTAQTASTVSFSQPAGASRTQTAKLAPTNSKSLLKGVSSSAGTQAPPDDRQQ